MTAAENHVKSKTYFVGERLTIADISYFAVIGNIIKLGAVDVKSMFPNLFRCYMTVGSMKVVTSVAGKIPTPALVIASSASSTSKAIVESSRIDAGNFPGKWQRNRTRVKELLYQDTAMIGKVRNKTNRILNLQPIALFSKHIDRHCLDHCFQIYEIYSDSLFYLFLICGYKGSDGARVGAH